MAPEDPCDSALPTAPLQRLFRQHPKLHPNGTAAAELREMGLGGLPFMEWEIDQPWGRFLESPLPAALAEEGPPAPRCSVAVPRGGERAEALSPDTVGATTFELSSSLGRPAASGLVLGGVEEEGWETPDILEGHRDQPQLDQRDQPQADQGERNRRPRPTIVAEQQEQVKIAAQRGRGRARKGVSDAVRSENAKDFVKPVYPKTDAEAAWLARIIELNDKMEVIAGKLSPEALDDVVDAFFSKTIEQGEDVIQQGDDGDLLYICEKGELDCFVALPDPATGKMPKDKGTKVLTVGPGDLFGELALMYSAPRAATVCCKSEYAKLWALERDSFKMLLVSGDKKQEAGQLKTAYRKSLSAACSAAAAPAQQASSDGEDQELSAIAAEEAALLAELGGLDARLGPASALASPPRVPKAGLGRQPRPPRPPRPQV